MTVQINLLKLVNVDVYTVVFHERSLAHFYAVFSHKVALKPRFRS